MQADSIACPGNLPDRHGALVPDRLPTDAAGEQGRDADRNIGEHEQRECEGEQDLFPRGAVDAPPLGHGRDGTQYEHRQKQPAQDVRNGQEQRGDVLVGHEPVHRRADVDDKSRCRQDRAGRDVHGHVVAGEAPGNRLARAEYSPDHALAVVPEHLQVAA